MNFFSTDVNVNMFFFFFPLRGPAVQYTTDYLCVRVCVCLFWRISGGGVAVWELHEF